MYDERVRKANRLDSVAMVTGAYIKHVREGKTGERGFGFVPIETGILIERDLLI